MGVFTQPPILVGLVGGCMLLGVQLTCVDIRFLPVGTGKVERFSDDAKWE
jgi:hypothetical protein